MQRYRLMSGDWGVCCNLIIQNGYPSTRSNSQISTTWVRLGTKIPEVPALDVRCLFSLRVVKYSMQHGEVFVLEKYNVLSVQISCSVVNDTFTSKYSPVEYSHFNLVSWYCTFLISRLVEFDVEIALVNNEDSLCASHSRTLRVNSCPFHGNHWLSSYSRFAL